MRHKSDFVMQQVAALYVVVPVHEAAAQFNAMFTFNETGAFLWSLLDAPQTADSLTEALCQAFDVDDDTARRDVHAFLQRLADAKLLDDGTDA